MNAFTQVVKTTLILNAIAIAVGGGVAVTKEAVKFVKNKRDEKKNYYKAEIIEVCQKRVGGSFPFSFLLVDERI